ncbi:MAG: hypothetical protein RL141_908 [Candidatus Parcubacteria bacterium]|jgi:predicted dehydrogenase
MSSPKRYKALIIGAGRIGCLFDTPQSSAILTHAHGYKRYARTELAGIADTDARRAHVAARRWGCRAYTSVAEAMEYERPDIVSVCTPDATHGVVLKALLRGVHRPRLVICEKPVTLRLSETARLVTAYQKARIPLLINHTRRFDPTVVSIKHDLDAGMYGNVLGGFATYGKGILHSGPHIIDLARYFFGEVTTDRTLFSRKDYAHPVDRTVGAFLAFRRCPQFYLMAGDASRYDYFQFDILCEKGRISFDTLGFRVTKQRVIPDPVYAGYQGLSAPISKKTQFDVAMVELVRHAVACLEGTEPLRCSAKDAYHTQTVCERLLRHRP